MSWTVTSWLGRGSVQGDEIDLCYEKTVSLWQYDWIFLMLEYLGNKNAVH